MLAKYQRLFFSRFTLTFFKGEDENEYQESLNENFILVRLRNIIVSFCLQILGLFVLISKLSSSEENIQAIKILVYVSILLCFLCLLTYCFISKKVNFFSKRRLQINKIITGLNYIFIKLFFHVILVLFDFTQENMECLIFLFLSINSCMTLYVFFFINSILQHFICNLIIVIMDCLLFRQYLSFKTNYIYFVIVISILTNSLIAYANEVSSRIYYFITSKKRSKFEQNLNNIFDGMRLSIFTFDKYGSLSYCNGNFLDYLNMEDKNERKELYMRSGNVFEIFKNNKFIERRENDKSLDKINFFHILLSSLTTINEDLLNINKELYEYMKKISEADKDITTKDFINKFLSLFNREFTTSGFPKLKLTTMKSEINNIINKSSDIHIVDTKNIQNSFTAPNMESELPLIHNESCNYSQLYLGKLDLKLFFKKLNNIQRKKEVEEGKDYLLYFSSSNSGDMVFYIEEKDKVKHTVDNPEILKLCKSLFFSKISHEFKNPICNMIEALDSIEDDTHFIDLKHEIFESSPKTENSCKLVSIQSSNTHLENLHFSGIKTKLATLLNNKGDKIKNLKCLVNILLYLVKDFTSYSKISDLKDEVQSVDIHNVSTRAVLPSTFKNSRTTFSNLSNRIKSNLFNKECDYYQIIDNLIQIFNTKIHIDKKESKFSLNLFLNGEVPQSLEIDRDIFESFIFNTFYHFYKTIDTGRVKLTLNFEKEEENKGRLYFSFFIKGSFNIGSLKEFLIKENNRLNFTNQFDISFTKNLSIENYRKHTTPFETYHLENLMNNNNSVFRNSIIDSFNNNFHSYLSCLYAEKLGAKIKLEIKNKKEYVINFSIQFDSSKIVLKSQEYFSYEYPKNTKIGKINTENYEIQSEKTKDDFLRFKQTSNTNLENFEKKIKNGLPLLKNIISTASVINNNKLIENIEIKENVQEASENFEESLMTIKNEVNLKFEYTKYIEEDSFVRKFKQIETEKQSELSQEVAIENNRELLARNRQVDWELNINQEISPKTYYIKKSSYKRYSTRKYSEHSNKDSLVGESNEHSRAQTIKLVKNSVSTPRKKKKIIK